jgi:hypothetical protein
MEQLPDADADNTFEPSRKRVSKYAIIVIVCFLLVVCVTVIAVFIARYVHGIQKRAEMKHVPIHDLVSTLYAVKYPAPFTHPQVKQPLAIESIIPAVFRHVETITSSKAGKAGSGQPQLSNFLIVSATPPIRQFVEYVSKEYAKTILVQYLPMLISHAIPEGHDAPSLPVDALLPAWRTTPLWHDIIQPICALVDMDPAYCATPQLLFVPNKPNAHLLPSQMITLDTQDCSDGDGGGGSRGCGRTAYPHDGSTIQPISPSDAISGEDGSEPAYNTLQDSLGIQRHEKRHVASFVLFLGALTGFDIDGDGSDDYTQYMQATLHSKSGKPGGIRFAYVDQTVPALMGSAVLWSRVTSRGVPDPRAKAILEPNSAAPYYLALVVHFNNVPNPLEQESVDVLVTSHNHYQHVNTALPDP